LSFFHREEREVPQEKGNLRGSFSDFEKAMAEDESPQSLKKQI